MAVLSLQYFRWLSWVFGESYFRQIMDQYYLPSLSIDSRHLDATTPRDLPWLTTFQYHHKGISPYVCHGQKLESLCTVVTEPATAKRAHWRESHATSNLFGTYLF